MNLLESYKGRLSVAEKYYSEKTGAKLSQAKKIAVAQCLNNTAR